MGLIQDVKHYKKVKEFESIFFEVFGMTVAEAKKILTEKSTERIDYEPTETEKVAIQKAQNKKSTPEQLEEMFKDDIEEFYPYGKPVASNN